ncbi:hypothetical protein Ciccas_008965 [Cichlidogyrus casuarinus]|uniref:cystathionine beta-synthase n=1 Tax=Cichlidogyrus casuarinus TaxID=1844966 RepID=A0ABD2PYT3_9PLAT
MPEEWKRPDKPSKCTFKLTSKLSESPHQHVNLQQRSAISDNVLETVGNTPLVRMHKLPKNEKIACEVLAKCEFMNPGGSVKDRIAVRMVLDAEKIGQLKAHDMIIEPTSGNTGIGLALAAAVKNYRCTILLPEKMSQEKISVLKALGAEIVRTRTSANFDDEDSHLRIADRMQKESPSDRHILNQYTNPSNPIAHFDGTAAEIIRDCGDKPPDMVVMTAGTGGTICGVARRIKQELPNCLVIGVDPRGSILAKPDQLNKKYDGSGIYHVEGIGYDFLPTVIEHDYVDKWYKSDDKTTFELARRLIRDEGFLCGGSSGSAIWGTLMAIRDYKFDQDASKRVVVLLPDSVRNYMTKFLSDDWMLCRGFLDFPAESAFLQKLSGKSLDKLVQQLAKPISCSPQQTVQEAIKQIKQKNCLSNGFALVTQGDTVIGVVDQKQLVKKLLTNTLALSDPISKAMNKEFLRVECTDEGSSLVSVARLLMTEPYCVLLGHSSGPFLIHDAHLLATAVE